MAFLGEGGLNTAHARLSLFILLLPSLYWISESHVYPIEVHPMGLKRLSIRIYHSAAV